MAFRFIENKFLSGNVVCAGKEWNSLGFFEMFTYMSDHGYKKKVCYGYQKSGYLNFNVL